MPSLSARFVREREVRVSSAMTPLKSASQGTAGRVAQDQERSPEMPRSLLRTPEGTPRSRVISSSFLRLVALSFSSRR